MADILEDIEDNEKSFEIARRCLDSGEIDDEDLRINAMTIAARTAMKLGKKEAATKLVLEMPVSQLKGGLGKMAVQLKIELGDKEGAFELAKTLLSTELDGQIIETANSLAQELGRRKEVQEIIRTNPDLEKGRIHDPELIWQLDRLGYDVSDLHERYTVLRRARHRT